MREKPILFNGPMVRAILAGQKSQTRRVCNPQPSANAHVTTFGGKPMRSWWETGGDIKCCPHGQVGDRLWVRESYADLRGTGIEHRPDTSRPIQRYAYSADTLPGSAGDFARKDFGIRWRPSIHMPRDACRLVLEVTHVRVEQLQAISDADCLAEGIQACRDGGYHVERGSHYSHHPVESFASLWASTGAPWESNPWIWAITFKRVQGAD